MRILCVLLFLSQFTFGQITVESIWKTAEFRTAGVSGFRSMNDGIHFTKISEKDGKVTITMHKITDSNGEGKVLVSADELTLNGQPIDIQEYEFNSDESKILIMTKMESIYRRSYVAVHYLLDLKTKKIEPLYSDR